MPLHLLPRTIRARLVLTVLLAVLPALALILATGIANRERALARAESDARELVVNLATVQERIADGIQMLLTTLARVPEVRNLDPEASRALFSDLLARNPQYANIMAADANGTIIATGTSSGSVNVADRLHFRRAMAEREFVAGEYIVSRTGGLPSFPFGYPLIGPDGLARGIVGALIRLDAYAGLYGTANLPPDSIMSVVDHAGVRLFFYPSMGTNPVGRQIRRASWERVVSGPETGSFSETGSDGIRRIYAYKQLRLRPDEAPYLFIFVGIPEAGVMTAANQRLIQSLMLLAIAAGLALIMAWVGGGVTIGRLIDRMAATAVRFGSGDLRARTGIPPDAGELGLLASTFDTMAQNLEHAFSERRKAESALSQSRRMLSTILDTVPQAIFWKDRDSRYLGSNMAFARLAGLENPEEIIGRHDFEMPWPREDALAYVADDVEVMRANEPKPNIIEPLRGADGVMRMISTTKLPLRDAEGEAYGVLGIFEDVSDRLLAEETLRESEMRYRALFEQVQDPIMLADAATGELLDCNQAALDTFGYTRDELLGHHQRMLHPSDGISPEGFSPTFKAHLGEAEGQLLDAKVVTKSGASIDVVIKARVFDLMGRRVSLGIFHDVTERNRFEEHIQASLKEKEILLREIHHRVKNNLQIVSGLLYLQADRIADPDALDLFLESRSRIASMALVHEELYRSSDFACVNLRNYVEKLLPKLSAALAGSTAIDFRLDLADAEVNIDAAVPFGLLFNELVMNALKHAFPGREAGTIRVQVRRLGDEVEAVIADDGVGLPEGLDLRNTSTLGMQLVVSLADQLKARLDVANTPGAAFTIRFPV